MSDNTDTTSNEYAYGSDTVNGCECPATAAGLDTTHGAVSRIAGRYDERVRDGYKGGENDSGTIPSDKAKQEWQAAIKETRKEGTDEQVEYGELVVKRLWPDKN